MTDSHLAALIETLGELPGVYVCSGGERAPKVVENGWRLCLGLDPLDGGLRSIALIVSALRQTHVRCGLIYDPQAMFDWGVLHVLASRGGDDPDTIASLIAERYEEWKAA